MAAVGAEPEACGRLISSRLLGTWRHHADGLGRRISAVRSALPTMHSSTAWRLAALTCWSVAPAPTVVSKHGDKPTVRCNTDLPESVVRTATSSGFQTRYRTWRTCSSTCRRSATAQTTIRKPPSQSSRSFKTSTKRRTYGDGEPYLRIMIVFDGDQKALDPRWKSGLIRRIRPKLIEAGVEEFPVRHSWKSPNGRDWSGA